MCEGYPLVKIVPKTKLQPKAITLVRAEWEADEKRRPHMCTEKKKIIITQSAEEQDDENEPP
jgi:hypothetical protein